MANPVVIKDGNQQLVNLGAVVDSSSYAILVHAVATTNTLGTASAVGSTNPLPVINAAGSAASDGSGTIANGGTPQTLFGGVIPTNGYFIQNNSDTDMYINDVGAASSSGASIKLAATGGSWTTPTGYKPPGLVSIFCATSTKAFAARRW